MPGEKHRQWFGAGERGGGAVLGPEPDPADGRRGQHGDGMENAWEAANGLDPENESGGGGNPDNDDLSNLEEFLLGTNPQVAEPPNVDADKDGLTNGEDADHSRASEMSLCGCR